MKNFLPEKYLSTNFNEKQCNHSVILVDNEEKRDYYCLICGAKANFNNDCFFSIDRHIISNEGLLNYYEILLTKELIKFIAELYNNENNMIDIVSILESLNKPIQRIANVLFYYQYNNELLQKFSPIRYLNKGINSFNCGHEIIKQVSSNQTNLNGCNCQCLLCGKEIIINNHKTFCNSFVYPNIPSRIKQNIDCSEAVIKFLVDFVAKNFADHRNIDIAKMFKAMYLDIVSITKRLNEETLLLNNYKNKSLKR